MEGRIASSAVNQTKHNIPMQLAHVAARTDRAIRLHCEVWPTTTNYWLHIRSMRRVLFICVACTICMFGAKLAYIPLSHLCMSNANELSNRV